MKKLNFILTIAVMALTISCQSGPDVRVSGEEAPAVIEVSQGKTLSIELKSQISTGFSWRLTQEPSKITLLKEEIITLKKMPGAPELHKFLFKAEKKGRERLLFKYARFWMKKPKAAKTFEVEVQVK